MCSRWRPASCRCPTSGCPSTSPSPRRTTPIPGCSPFRRARFTTRPRACRFTCWPVPTRRFKSWVRICVCVLRRVGEINVIYYYLCNRSKYLRTITITRTRSIKYIIL
uniref:(northern house mosquito) hypothetical protein n=1 Tax=Culex pipiens TaxID=7175 RepID=A0A8D8DX74_CULPI